MTVGKDVSTLFPDVINCIQTGTNKLFGNDAYNNSCTDRRLWWRQIDNFYNPVNHPFIRQSGAEEISLSVPD